MNELDLSIVIVNWKVADLVERLLDSIAAQASGITLEIFVVDNASGDDLVPRVERFRARNPHLPLELICNDKNLGFAKACNQAIRKSRGRYVVLLNPDTEVLDGALQKIVARLDQLDDVGVAGPMLLNEDGTIQPSVRRLPLLIDQALMVLQLHQVEPLLPPLKRYLQQNFDYSKEQDVEQVMGAAFFIRRACLDEIGLLDELFFIWFEEVDFCKRALSHGWRVFYTPVARIRHRGGASFAQEGSARKQRMYLASMTSYFGKHRGAWAPMVLLPVILFGLMIRGLRNIWRSRRGK